MKSFILAAILALAIGGCTSQLPGTAADSQQDMAKEGVKTLSVGDLSERAQTMYGQALKAGRSKQDAALEVATFLMSQPNVRNAQITGSDTVRVFFENGDDIVLLLGKDRL